MAHTPSLPDPAALHDRSTGTASSPSLSDATALRDETVLRRMRHFGSAHDGLREWQLQRKWVAKTGGTRRRWNRDNEPHADTWDEVINGLEVVPKE